MDFITFARAHGVLINRFRDDGRWHRCPTVDKPKSTNGAYKCDGARGWVQDWGTMVEPSMWVAEGANAVNIDHEAVRRRAQEASAEIRRDQARAAGKAGALLHQTHQAGHPYLAAKGFPEEVGNVLEDPQDKLSKLIIPMRVDGRLVGAQQIYEDPETPGKFIKKFLYGQRSELAVYVMNNKGRYVYCEGYATALSVRAALQAIKIRYTIFVCFSAANMVKVAEAFGPGLVIADYDSPSKLAPEQGGMGWKVAKDIGMPWWTSDTEGEDFNDFHRRVGLFKASQSLKQVAMRRTA
jgi:hypothetical protein